MSSGDEVDYATLSQNCKVARRPPVTPSTFEQELRARSFTSGTDSKIVQELYDRTFRELSHSVTRLSFRNLLWSQDEARMLSETLPTFVNCLEVDLSYNPFGIHGIQVLMDKVADMTNLRRLSLQHCRGMNVADQVQTWSPSLRKMAHCEVLNLSENRFGRSIAQDQSRPKSNEQQETHPNLRIIRVAKASHQRGTGQGQRARRTHGADVDDSAFQDVA